MEFHKYSKIYRIGHKETQDIFSDPGDEIIIEEKIDGGNFRFYISEEGKVIIGSRTQQLTSNEGEDTNMNKTFKRCSDYIRSKLNGKDLSTYTGFIFYGENCVKHTLEYDWDKIPPFLGFDISIEGEYLTYDERLRIFNDLDLLMVPFITRTKANEIKEINDDLVPVSEYAPRSNPNQKAEGVVFKNYSKQLMAKYVRNEFKEKNSEVFGGNPKYNKVDDTDNSKIVFKYCTNARIDKIVFKLVDEGHELEMKMMKELPKRVYGDIMEEEGREILESRWIVDFNKLRKLITKRCSSVLNQIITNNGLK